MGSYLLNRKKRGTATVDYSLEYPVQTRGLTLEYTRDKLPRSAYLLDCS